MAKINLDKLNLKELKVLQKDVAKAIDAFETRRRKEALAAAEAAAGKMGFNLAELTGNAKKKTRAAAPAKYRHPENPALTWSGRGRRPQWFVQAIEAGNSPDELEIA